MPNPLNGTIEGNIARSRFDRKKMAIVTNATATYVITSVRVIASPPYKLLRSNFVSSLIYSLLSLTKKYPLLLTFAIFIKFDKKKVNFIKKFTFSLFFIDFYMILVFLKQYSF